MAQVFVQLDLIILFTFNCTLLELIAEFVIIITIVNSSILCCSVNDDVQTTKTQRTQSNALKNILSYMLKINNLVGISAGVKTHVCQLN
jgi:hypothetical protein